MVQGVSQQDMEPISYAWPVWAENLTVRAGRKVAVSGVDLALTNGVYGILGPNGAGKTTLLRALATAQRPTGGRLELVGQAVHDGGDLRAVRRSLGYLPQNFGYYRSYTVREFVEYLAWLKGVSTSDVPAASQRAIDLVGLSEQADARLRTLSGGMVRRAGLAQALVGDPPILLLDEPTTGLDPQTRQKIRELLWGLAESTCVVMATHLIEDVATDSAEVLIMNTGRFAFRGGIAQVREAGSSLEHGLAVLLERVIQ
ncbi:ATP-binding cassette domain-containing protein [Kineosporia rhizophila]|uniref:ATP-binding cassette domain-containing protein n=1 Tax=Kineosporia rhizophila TaxID=84633 RepID=UPI000A448E5E|nr:ATP-binding cassette domain-containing protein [Kineosporia rhizophila]